MEEKKKKIKSNLSYAHVQVKLLIGAIAAFQQNLNF